MQSNYFVVESRPIQKRCEVREADVAVSPNSPSSSLDRRVFSSVRPKMAQHSSGRRISIAPSFLAVHDSPDQQHRPGAYSSTSARSHLRCQAKVSSVDFSAGLSQPPHNIVHPYLYIFVRNSVLANSSRHRPKRLSFEMFSQRGQILAPPTSRSNAVYFANVKDHPCAGSRTAISALVPAVALFRGRSCTPAKPLAGDG